MFYECFLFLCVILFVQSNPSGSPCGKWAMKLGVRSTCVCFFLMFGLVWFVSMQANPTGIVVSTQRGLLELDRTPQPTRAGEQRVVQAGDTRGAGGRGAGRARQ